MPRGTEDGLCTIARGRTRTEDNTTSGPPRRRGAIICIFTEHPWNNCCITQQNCYTSRHRDHRLLTIHNISIKPNWVFSTAAKNVDLFNRRRYSPVWGKGNPLLPVLICFHIRKFVPRSGGGGLKAIYRYFWKNAAVQEDSYSSIYLFRLNPKVYINLTFYLSKILGSLTFLCPQSESPWHILCHK